MSAGKIRLPIILFILIFSSTALSCKFLTGGADARQAEPSVAPTRIAAEVTAPTIPPAADPLENPAGPAQAVPAETTPDACPLGDCVSSCMTLLADTKLEYLGKEGEIDDEYYPEEPVVLASYLVDGNEIAQYFKNNDIPAWLEPFRDDFDYHLGIWHLVAVILPDSIRSYVKEFHVTTDGVDEILASTYQTETDMRAWALDVDILDTTDLDYFLSTIVHEFSHLITLNPAQVTPNEAVFENPDNENIYEKEAAACPTYFPDACSHPDSYINLFYDRFWKNADFYPRWEKINAMDYGDQYDSALTKFFEDYQDRFVTEYAATNIDEDMAESFTLFILEPRPAGDTVAQEKILFFYDFPELVQMRREMASGLCALAEE